MAQERTEAVVLRGVDYSETSRIVTMLTPGRGRVACMAKGARRKQSPLAAVLDTFNRVEMVYYWKDGRAVQQLSEAALLDGFGPIKAHLEKSAYAAWPAELAGKVAHENEPSETLYATFVDGLNSLAAWQGDVRAHACWQAAQLLSAAGFEPALESCAECGAPVDDAPGFSYTGGVTCGGCRRDRRLSRPELECLRRLAWSRDACPDGPVLTNVYYTLCQYAARQIEADFRSIRVIDQMFGGKTE